MTTIDQETLVEWQNGNGLVTLYADGTRVITSDGPFKPSTPLNVDIRVSTRCAFGLNRKTGKSVCDFCHESAETEGVDADIGRLMNVLWPLPAGTEIAMGINHFDFDFDPFAHLATRQKKWIINITINQGHVPGNSGYLKHLIGKNYIKGLGISYRTGMTLPPKDILGYQHTVFHVIAGIDRVEDVLALASQGVRKVLVLGEKDFGFNSGRVNLASTKHVAWYRNLRSLFDVFEVVSFDNLALEQLNVERLIRDYSSFYQGEHSMYIDAANGFFSRSSRSAERVDWNSTSILEFFRSLQ